MCRFLKRHFSMCSNWMMTDTDSRELEVYVHIPFCVRKCRYCDFLSAPADAVVREKYVEVLEKQTERWALPGRTVSVFLGGGTPSVLNTEQAGRIVDAVHRCFELTSDCEVTMECNPGTLNREKLEAYRSFGINRLSLGLQSADDTELARLGRIHRFSDFRENYLQAREAGFENISVDLMYGLPGQTVESWTETLKKVLDLRPEHLSVYSLIIEPGTEFYRLYHEDDERRGAGWRMPVFIAMKFPIMPGMVLRACTTAVTGRGGNISDLGSELLPYYIEETRRNFSAPGGRGRFVFMFPGIGTAI